jgi:S-adenosylmethionine synthetase
VTGTSAESGDDGEVGRGNRASGLITPYRPMTMEAVAGKNPVTHVGKIYNIVASRIAAAAVTECPGVTGAECLMVSGIGRSVSDPRVVDLRVVVEASADLSRLRPHLHDIVAGSLNRISDVRDALLQQHVPVA